ncbi:amidohydrolase family protein [Bordetella sp. H567]|uniref:amidohydrolase family protein n=1 Tax=Bordetella sp. H567 TaxID=1697043 RepID=UPI000A73BAB9|nr:amidohydrolase family protein [Bordetella sp. H567]
MEATADVMAVTGVDAHAHVMRQAARLVPERHSAPHRDVDVDEFIGLLNAHGLSHGVLTAPSFLGTDNTLLLDALSRYPGRLAGTAIVDPAIDVETLAGMRDMGVAGIRLNWVRRATLPDIDTPAYAGLLRHVRALGLHVELFLEDAPTARVLPRLVDHGVDVVLDHFGCPDPEQGVSGPGFVQVLKAVRAGQAWVKLSAPYRLGGAEPRRYVDALLDAGGPQRLMWGSDFPWVGHEAHGGGIRYADCLDWLSAWLPQRRLRDVVLRDTPARVFGFARARRPLAAHP